MSEEKQPEQNKSTRSFEEWEAALQRLATHRGHPVIIDEDRIRPYYEQGLQPYVVFNELFNK